MKLDKNEQQTPNDHHMPTIIIMIANIANLPSQTSIVSLAK
jgi:hypothetical protein